MSLSPFFNSSSQHSPGIAFRPFEYQNLENFDISNCNGGNALENVNHLPPWQILGRSLSQDLTDLICPSALPQEMQTSMHCLETMISTEQCVPESVSMFSQEGDCFESDEDLFSSLSDEEMNLSSLVPMASLDSGDGLRRMSSEVVSEILQQSVRRMSSVEVDETLQAVNAQRIKSLTDSLKLKIKRPADSNFVASCSAAPTFCPSLTRIAESSNESAGSGLSPKSSKRVYHRRVPSRKDFASEKDYLEGFEAWRSLRDRNNKAVRKSRGLTDEPVKRRNRTAPLSDF